MNAFLLVAQVPEVLIYAITALVAAFIIISGLLAVASKFYQKVGPDEAIVRTGWGGMQVVTANGVFVAPVVHHAEKMDLTLKSFEIAREGS